MWAGLELWVFGSSESTKLEEEEGEEMEEDSKEGSKGQKSVCVCGGDSVGVEWRNIWALGDFRKIILFVMLCYMLRSFV